MNVTPIMPLKGRVPLVQMKTIEKDVNSAASEFEDQLAQWGFMALEMPGINEKIEALFKAFSTACSSTSPSLNDHVYTSVPQLASGGNHGFFPFESEIPRLASGTPDPKEFIHVSGAMLDDVPTGARATMQEFPYLWSEVASTFSIGFQVALSIGHLLRNLLPEGAPDLGLFRHSSILRVIHYRDTEGREILAHEHSGIQMLGVQFPPSDGGLQYLLHDGNWVEPELKGTDIVLCNIGRMLAYASSERFRPSTHRVHRSSRSPDYERWSSVLFLHPNHEDRQWTINEHGVTFHDSTWGDAVRNRFRGLGIKL